MTVGNRFFSGKGAREAAANALTSAILSWRDDQTMQARGALRGFEVLSRGKSGGFGLLQEDDRIPDLFVRGRGTYSAKGERGQSCWDNSEHRTHPQES